MLLGEMLNNIISNIVGKNKMEKSRTLNQKGLLAFIEASNQLVTEEFEIEFYDSSEVYDELNSLPFEQKEYEIEGVVTKSGKPEKVKLEEDWFDYVIEMK